MKTKSSSNRSGRAERGAFTLVELMVVITIMAALAALTASATLKFIAVQQTSNTQSTLDRAQSQLARAWSKAKDQALKEQYPPGVENWIKINLSGSDANTAKRTRILYVKLRLRQQFPMSFTEALTPPTLPGNNICPLLPLPAYVTYLNSLGITMPPGSTANTAAIESSACLLMALQRGAGGAGIDPSELTAGGAAGNYPWAGGKTIPYLTDAWGRPIFFTRAPAGNLYLNPMTNPTTGTANLPNLYNVISPMFPLGFRLTCNSSPGANDPGDPEGLLLTANWNTTYGPAFYLLTSQVVPLAKTSYKLAPMLASGGPTDWTKPGQTLPFDPITFYTRPGSDALFSTP
jgi:prepilin-type N-terminal cleavage/methylation domain-containing protein